jgi:hypothetical protein
VSGIVNNSAINVAINGPYLHARCPGSPGSPYLSYMLAVPGT